MTVYASWNGATGVAGWRVLAGPGTSSLTPVADAADSGFETAIATSTTQPYIAVQALDAHGHVMATSSAVKR